MPEIEKHLHQLSQLIREQDSIKLVVRLESLTGSRVRYLAVVSCNEENAEEFCLLGIDGDQDISLGLVLAILSYTTIRLDGDGYEGNNCCSCMYWWDDEMNELVPGAFAWPLGMACEATFSNPCPSKRCGLPYSPCTELVNVPKKIIVSKPLLLDTMRTSSVRISRIQVALLSGISCLGWSTEDQWHWICKGTERIFFI